MSRDMADACVPSNIPDGVDLVAYYVDGICAAAPVKGRQHVGISSLATDAGTVGDCEPGNPRPVAWVEWVQRRRAAGVDPTLYVPDDSLGSFFAGYHWSEVRAVFAAAGVPEPHWWVTKPGATEIPPGAVAVQNRLGIDGDRYDLSLVADYWPGVDPEPPPAPEPPPLEDDMTGPIGYVNPFNGQPHTFQVRDLAVGLEHWWQIQTTWQKPEVLPGSAGRLAAGALIHATTSAPVGQLQVWVPLADGSGQYHAWIAEGAASWSWEIVA